MAEPGALTPFVDDLAAAARSGDHDAFFPAGRRLAEQVPAASRADLDAAVARAAPVLTEAPRSLGGPLAQYLGSLVGQDGDATPLLAPLVERACEGLEASLLLVRLHEELVGPAPERAACGDEEYERFVAAAAGRVEDPDALARSWMHAPEFVQVLLVLCQRADVRRALPQRARLTASATAAQDVLADLAPWLVGLLRILDDETLVVLHRPTGAGFRVTTSGVADNFQLHTLLAAHLIPLLPTPRRGLLGRRDVPVRPEPPTPAMTAAADGSGEHAPAGGVAGAFNLVDATGAWIWDEGRPDEIPRTDGVRVVVLDPPPYARSWDAGRAYPLLRATVDVVPLPAGEAASWLSRVAPALSAREAVAAATTVAGPPAAQDAAREVPT